MVEYRNVTRQETRNNPPAKHNDPFPPSYYQNQKVVQEKIARMKELKKRTNSL